MCKVSSQNSIFYVPERDHGNVIKTRYLGGNKLGGRILLTTFTVEYKIHGVHSSHPKAICHLGTLSWETCENIR